MIVLFDGLNSAALLLHLTILARKHNDGTNGV